MKWRIKKKKRFFPFSSLSLKSLLRCIDETLKQLKKEILSTTPTIIQKINLFFINLPWIRTILSTYFSCCPVKETDDMQRSDDQLRFGYSTFWFISCMQCRTLVSVTISDQYRENERIRIECRSLESFYLEIRNLTWTKIDLTKVFHIYLLSFSKADIHSKTVI